MHGYIDALTLRISYRNDSIEDILIIALLCSKYTIKLGFIPIPNRKLEICSSIESTVARLP